MIYFSRKYFMNRLVKRVNLKWAYGLGNGKHSESFKIVPTCIRASDSRLRLQNRLSTPDQDYGISSLSVNFPFFRHNCIYRVANFI